MRSLCLLAGLAPFLPLTLAVPFQYPHHRQLARAMNKHTAQDNSQTSSTLHASQIQQGLKKDGQQVPADGQVPSLTSGNNFINFCLTQKDVRLTDGEQVRNGSCNPTVMGRIIAENVMPSSKFIFPPNLDDSLTEFKTFTVKMAISNLQTGHFVNPGSNYFAAPSQVDGQGRLIGHSHVVIQAISSLNSTQVLDPRKFAFFQGLNEKAISGILSANVSKGLPAGVYRMGSINTAANHQPALVSVAQHGMLDDIVYFTVKKTKGSNQGRKRDQGSAMCGEGAQATQSIAGDTNKKPLKRPFRAIASSPIP